MTFKRITQGVVIALLLCAGVLTGSCASSPEPVPPHTSTLEVKLTEVLTIGLETHENDLLGQPEAVVTDAEGRLLIADRSIPAIRVFDADGQWQHDIGGRGEGPVEFTTLHQLTMMGSDTLLAVDGMAMRGTLVDTRGEVIDIWPLQTVEDGSLMLWALIPGRQDDQFIVVGNHYVSTDPRDDHPHTALHHVHREAEGFRIEQQFVDLAEDLGREGFGLAWGANGSILALNAEELLYTPQLYDGQLQHLAFDPTEEAWTRTTPWNGVVETTTPYELLDDDAYPGPNVTVVGSPVGRFVGRTLNQSAGLATLPDGRIAHFTRIKVDEKEQFGVEVYEPSGERVGYAALWRRPYPEDPTNLPYVDAIDEAGQVYLRAHDEDTGAPVVKVMQLKIEE